MYAMLHLKLYIVIDFLTFLSVIMLYILLDHELFMSLDLSSQDYYYYFISIMEFLLKPTVYLLLQDFTVYLTLTLLDAI